MADPVAKDSLFAALAWSRRRSVNGRRAEIVEVLVQGEQSVDEIAGEIGQSVANTSQHLQVLAQAGLVQSPRAGTRVFYRVASEAVVDLRRRRYAVPGGAVPADPAPAPRPQGT
jgi:DNA-binding transcriptional ArsR family regulator